MFGLIWILLAVKYTEANKDANQLVVGTFSWTALRESHLQTSSPAGWLRLPDVSNENERIFINLSKM